MMLRETKLWALGGAVLIGLAGGCAPPTDTQVDEGARAGEQALTEGPTLRAAAIAAIQADADARYDLIEAADEAAAFRGDLVASGLTVRHSTRGAEIAPAGDEPDLGLRVAGAGCEGSVASAQAAGPQAQLNRARYQHALADGRALEAWYVSGPLGLEQGFTLAESWGCASTEIHVAVSGADVEPGKTPEDLSLVSFREGTRYRYGDLYAHDADGAPLATSLERRDGGVIALVVDTRGAKFPVTVDPLVATEQAKVTASDAGDNEFLGYAVAVDGDTAVVGTWGDDTGAGADAGSAYVFTRTGTTWSQQAKLTASDAAAGDQFGISVAVSGDTAVIGASFSEAAYVFSRSGTTWSEQAILTATDGAAGDSFGFSVALSGNTALIGAYGDDTAGGTDAGSAYVFTRSGSTWSQQTKLTASDGSTQDYYGLAVAISGDTALVGAYADDNAGGVDAGAAYVYFRVGTTWSQQSKVTAADGAADDQLGVSVAITADTALVGAYADSHAGGTSAGSAYIFVRSGSTWSQQTKLIASDAAANDFFGYSVALNPDRAVIGAYADDVAAGANAGSAYVFTRAGTVWSQAAKMTASDGATGDFFGYAVALSGNTAFIGAYGDDNAGGVEAGGAYAELLQLDIGDACSSNADCGSGFCADGYCCNAACGGTNPSDCQACSVAAGASANGACTVLAAATICRADAGTCDVAETCDGTSAVCPADVFEPDGTSCGTGTCSAGVCSGYSLTGVPSNVSIGANVVFNFTAPSGHSAVDWIGLFPVGGQPYEYLNWTYVGAPTSGSLSLQLPVTAIAGQSYELRYLLNNGYTVGTTSSSFIASAYAVTAVESYPQPGTFVTANWTADTAHSTLDWIGLYQPGTADSSFLSYAYVGAGGQATGSAQLAMPAGAQPGDQLELRYFLNNTYQRAATSAAFTTGNTLTAPAGPVPPGSNVTTTWSAPASHATVDWIGLFQVGAANTAFEQWAYVGASGVSTADLTLLLPATAQEGQAYEFRYFLNNSYTVIGRSASFLVGAAYTLSGPAGPVTAGNNADGQWTAPAFHSANDWIGLYAVGAQSTAFVSYTYVGSAGLTSGTTPVTVPPGTPAGNYELRYFTNNTYSLVATSGTFPVQ